MPIPKISLGVPPGPLALESIDLAEKLNYHRVWLYDSAAIWEDVWITMGLAAQRTNHIGLGTAVLIPNLRHVMTTASAIATIDRIAPGRLACGFGTGFTGRRVLGQKPLSWSYTKRYIRQLKALLIGEVVEIDGEECQMIHHPAMAAPRPIEVEIILSAFGPKGQEVARELAEGVMTFGKNDGSWDQFLRMVHGTVLRDGESQYSERAIDAAGPWWVVQAHSQWESEGDEALLQWPGGDEYLKQVSVDRPENQRHLAIHEGHCTHLTDRDRILVNGVDGQPSWNGWVGDREDIMQRVEAEAAAGVTELIFNTGGSNPLREIRAFAEAAIG